MADSVPFDRVADCYDASRGGEQRAQVMADLVTAHLPPTGTVLELGVGTGIVAEAVTASGPTVLGVDLAPAMVARARQRLGQRVAIGDAMALPVADTSVDAAYLVWVLHLVADPLDVLAEAVRVVRPGGAVAAVPTSWAGFGPPGPPDGDLERIQARLGVLRSEIATPDEVSAWMAEVGLSDITSTERLDTRTQSPGQTADLIEQRAWSMLWDVDEPTWSEVVVPVIEELRSLPDQDGPRTIAQRVTVVAGRRR